MDSLPVQIIVPQNNLPHEYIRTLNDQLHQILVNPRFTPDLKMKMFQQLMHTYSVTQDKMTAPQILDVVSTPRASNSDIDIAAIAESLPKTVRSQGTALLKRINADPSLVVNEKGELLVDGAAIRGSNITDLVHDFTRKRKQRGPTGYRELAKALKRQHIPKEFIGNTNRWHLMDEGSFTSRSPAEYFQSADNSIVETDTEQQQQIPWTNY